MTALTADTQIPEMEGNVIRRVVTNGVTVYKGAAVALVGGTLTNGTASNANKLDGVALEKQVGDGTKTVLVKRTGLFGFPVGDLVAADIGKNVRLVDNNTWLPCATGEGGQGRLVTIESVEGVSKAFIQIDTTGGPKPVCIAVPIVKKTSEFDTGIIVPAGTLITGVFGICVDAVSSGTVDVGTLSTDSGDADGFVDGMSFATAGYVPTLAPQDADSKNTLGALISNAAIKTADTTALYARIPKPYYFAAAKNISITTSNHDITGTVYLTGFKLV